MGLVFNWAVGIVCIALGSWTFRAGRIYREQSGGFALNNTGEHPFFLGSTQQELVKLAANLCSRLPQTALATFIQLPFAGLYGESIDSTLTLAFDSLQVHRTVLSIGGLPMLCQQFSS